ncbi:hypothetical protein A3J20_01210 [Candidatus Gottesmanbacteria bacterium RIFCSPLOWO2_02_FULL_42_29]|uniref:Antitoxin n=1 Tax=Candidatus Gottesmanbacteria bacterium RIFCSPLOWO2_01_FULL_42_22 TaxID=1798391 RepID=A0A1F6B9C9_9BACT|nr:MAG: hypothetical protein UV46_C0067G0003 [Candidatus Gottesmanbacteria bacterium GW2011_GWC2_42_8]OGG10978.1 MAG: hypothetical protein A2781_05935 [Candidatus Gottesmanbacteria bacterium RIFCSPHIGHO2_01_FULL_42_27]OGG20408.1 MAG: hypothetical protein A3E72_06365 [Candidatus Gottesmanbacteria bacterium RIFCSPHIGHO2_12_FULL_43_26]OGG33524.1 MAG: hypothetical protein A2968_01080 [Candidatus Gottesmanbacteria bacterium RIFCSPLOWO2_01_FULL_42_22]OGG39200.1 MAG: hypothetical protein A3J20_01210 [
MQSSKTIPASQVKNNFGSIVSQVSRGKYPEVIVENRGEPVVAIVSIEDLKVLKETRERARQKEALARLRQVRTRVQVRVKGKLIEQEADDIANRFSRELVEDLEKEGKIKFER